MKGTSRGARAIPHEAVQDVAQVEAHYVPHILTVAKLTRDETEHLVSPSVVVGGRVVGGRHGLACARGDAYILKREIDVRDGKESACACVDEFVLGAIVPRNRAAVRTDSECVGW